MTEYDIVHHHRSSFNCIDVNPDTVPGELVIQMVHFSIMCRLMP